MVEHQPSQLNAVFHALADPTRRAMLSALARGESGLKDLAKPFSMSLAGACKHVRVLEDAGLVRRKKSGRDNIIRLNPGGLKKAHQWISFYERFWRTRLDALEGELRKGERHE
ncbi:MAG: helix-turn-helix transcriptional regulator [Bryobacteraceae bacterium]|nr:helix-turn-helix transcriptional regulator [Bryobacteraceae bacterium]